jgi:3-oxoacyl-[acyl-carrier-protein] synthase II
MNPRAVITGIGLVTPIGNGVEEYWNALTAGMSGIGPITLFDTTGCAVTIGGEIKNLDFSKYIPPELSRKMSRTSKLAVVAARMALGDSGLQITDENRELIDVFMGVACPDLDTLAQNMVRRHERGERGVTPLMPAIAVTAAPTGNVSIMLGISGETTTLSTGCSSSTNAIGHALRKIRSGASQVIFAGGADVGVQADLIAAYANAKSLSVRNNDPKHACRPFEENRDGHVLSEAAGMLVLEELEHARRRGAKVYAEVVGYGTSSDCHSMVTVSENVNNASRCIELALRDAGRDPEKVGYYCAHGSAARLTDRRETNMLKRALGDRAYRVSVSSIKSMTGHPFGASGVLQAATCALAIKRKVVPPTINYEEPDPECDLDYVPNEAREEKVDTALAYSLGMGGNNAALAVAPC